MFLSILFFFLFLVSFCTILPAFIHNFISSKIKKKKKKKKRKTQCRLNDLWIIQNMNTRGNEGITMNDKGYLHSFNLCSNTKASLFHLKESESVVHKCSVRIKDFEVGSKFKS